MGHRCSCRLYDPGESIPGRSTETDHTEREGLEETLARGREVELGEIVGFSVDKIYGYPKIVPAIMKDEKGNILMGGVYQEYSKHGELLLEEPDGYLRCFWNEK